MNTLLQLCLNPALVAVILLCILCIRKVNVLLAIIISTIVAELVSGMHIQKIMDIFISGMGGNSETAETAPVGRSHPSGSGRGH